MAISYNIYANDGSGGDVDYLTPIATTSDLTYATGNLSTPSDSTFAVRAFDTVSGVEEANTDARVRIILDASGNNVTTRPNAVVGLSAWPTAGGTCWVSWAYVATGQGGPPSLFNVSLTAAGAQTSTANPAATVAYLPGVSGYGCSLSDLAGNTPYTILVQAVGASSVLLGPIATVPITYLATTLGDVDSLVASPMA
jgi:hypothetical protein